MRSSCLWQACGMGDHLSKAGRSRVMAAIRATNTKPELAVRHMLRSLGATGYRVHVRDLPGKPDIAFSRWKVAVFVDGAFWHGHPEHFNSDTAAPYWRDKIRRTRERDRLANDGLAELGWRCLRFWDFQIETDCLAVAEAIILELRRAGWSSQDD